MFDNDVIGLDAAGTLAAVEANEQVLVTAETLAGWSWLRIGRICIRAGV